MSEKNFKKYASSVFNEKLPLQVFKNCGIPYDSFNELLENSSTLINTLHAHSELFQAVAKDLVLISMDGGALSSIQFELEQPTFVETDDLAITFADLQWNQKSDKLIITIYPTGCNALDRNSAKALIDIVSDQCHECAKVKECNSALIDILAKLMKLALLQHCKIIDAAKNTINTVKNHYQY